MFCFIIEFKLQKELRWDHEGNHVLVAGSFNNWKPEQILEKRYVSSMSKNVRVYIYPFLSDNGQFSTFVDLPVGTHEYKFIVDGEWKHDPLLVMMACDGLWWNRELERNVYITWTRSCNMYVRMYVSLYAIFPLAVNS